MMDDLFERFPHLKEKMFEQLDYKSLLLCKEVKQTWNKAINFEKTSYLKIIKYHTKCRDELLEEILESCNSPIILVSIINGIFKNFPKGTKQSHQYLKTWGNTPLHAAARIGHKAAYVLIMDNVIEKNPLSKNLVPMKIWEKKPNQMKCFVDSTTEYTPLHAAAENGHFSVCKLIMDNVSEKNPPNNQKCTPLHVSAASGNQSIFQMIIKNIPGDKNPEDGCGYTPLHISAAYGHFEICTLILSYDVIVNRKYNSPQTPYHLAAANGNVAILQLLMEKKIHGQNTKNNWGQYPIHHAAKYGHLDVCKLIIDSAQNKEDFGPSHCNVKDTMGNSPIDFAIKNNHQEIQKYLRECLQYLLYIIVLNTVDWATTGILTIF